MTNRKSDKDNKKTDNHNDEQKKRVSPDSPLGEGFSGEDEDFYERQRRESPDGMTPSEREQHQKAAPGSLNQTTPDGEKVGEARDEANAHRKQQSSGI